MSVRLLFPTYVFERNLLDPNLPEDRGLSQQYMEQLVRECNAMRRKDPVGRQLSNQYTGWQSNDGCESHPAFQPLIKRIERTFYDEVWPFHGLNETECQMDVGNMWLNINDKGAWNAPHLHPGCWYSGVFYIRADGDEGDISFIDKDIKVVQDCPMHPRTRQEVNFTPISGELILFPSGTMHMVKPNLTEKDRYSVSFNMRVFNRMEGSHDNWNPDEFSFNLDPNGNPIF